MEIVQQRDPRCRQIDWDITIFSRYIIARISDFPRRMSNEL